MRIVAGKFKGLSLLGFDAENIRPTTDRVRENIFNKIQFAVRDAKVLDLFGGTGAVSLEFISRGAQSVTICDNNKKSVDLINKNFAKAGLVPQLLNCDYISALNQLKESKFDIIYLDPPYMYDYGEKSLEIIAQKDILADDGIIIYEHLQDKKYVLDDSLEIFDERKYGTISVSFIKKK